MKPDALARSYDRIAEDWLAPHLQTNGMAQLERALTFALRPGRALDIGCGCSGRFIALLRQRGWEAEGLDFSARMIELARRRQPDVTFHRADITAWDFPRNYDAVIAWDSTWHLPLAEQEPVMRKICAHLNPGGIFVFTTGGLDQPEEKDDASMGVPVHYSVLGIPRTLALLDECGCGCRHLEFDQHPEKHLYVIAQKR